MDKIIPMIDYLILLETARDKEWKKAMHQLHRDTEALGESAMLQHLRDLKKLAETPDKV